MPFTHRVHDDPSRCAIGEVHVAPTVRCSLLQEVTPMSEVVSPARIAAELTELWSPRVVAELDDSFVKVAKVHGSLAWHSHDDEDELFYVLDGCLRIEMEARTVVLNRGDAFVVPKGVRHNPVAEHACLVMLIERKSTLHTGNAITDKTRSIADQLRPV
jgi:mannose-6-phosphate isomerase-like protein (cupin superfamily)